MINRRTILSVVLQLLAVQFLTASSSARAETVAFWSFNDIGNATVSEVAADIGQGVGTTIGGVSGRAAEGTGYDDVVAGLAWELTDFPSQGTAEETAGVELRVPTLGYSNIVIRLDHFIGAGSALESLLQVTYDGINYTGIRQFGSDFIDPYQQEEWGDPLSMSYSFGTSNQNAASNNPNFGFRFVSDFYPSFNSTFYRSFGGAYSPDAAWRIDNILVTGDLLFRPGDFNGDGLVDAADYTVWRDAVGTANPSLADANRDGQVNASDYEVWASNYGSSSSGVTSTVLQSVPEPTTAVLLALGTLAAVGCRNVRELGEYVGTCSQNNCGDSPQLGQCIRRCCSM
ncbi:dockerin type I repeat-containing protein [Botrimarina mediterranea]|uniref:PEP-CTERM protein-sorting domain-containing protein n=1 Tax=Botrimarina mediterranea TaxID=2528022 RepID=A0A518K600_9BACT|nr:dockerin type I repeat-containing protein [Botrimarina mediterranea]QDV73223.1 hypothetical protein Spa11_14190 [Botrimarina mediterranea]